MSDEPIRALLELLPNAFYRVGASGDIIHASLGLSSGKRGILLSIEQNGPSTVSSLASLRPVSRQFVQRLVDELVEGDWLEAQPNPRHKRSPLIALTGKGSQAIAAMRASEAPYMTNLAAQLDRSDLRIAIRVLQKITSIVSPQALKELARSLSADVERELP